MPPRMKHKSWGQDHSYKEAWRRSAIGIAETDRSCLVSGQQGQRNLQSTAATARLGLPSARWHAIPSRCRWQDAFMATYCSRAVPARSGRRSLRGHGASLATGTRARSLFCGRGPIRTAAASKQTEEARQWISENAYDPGLWSCLVAGGNEGIGSRSRRPDGGSAGGRATRRAKGACEIQAANSEGERSDPGRVLDCVGVQKRSAGGLDGGRWVRISFRVPPCSELGRDPTPPTKALLASRPAPVSSRVC
ncbi:uncharacterized protein K452DRAFT_33176 [Aplosporella prunicola CBS 121167]|uniref:Uncharacterized protein n=1 Tax=Aplosporella prunicola CBS 121167 TaxID=1176127 RepID=A0A6A6BC82_9PEZI|nr:uncharacterized protein K452DRAFT_33176 [Aplosporella prunicola CBS 121167]KAF2141740.1 hypothetical protein K452DRAFT_33176 [Aplosporella prunicola CBS 121167]